MLDADIYGPSQPMMLGIAGRPESKDGKRLEPMEGHGLQAISIGFLIDIDTPMVWRGPMVTQALEQLLKDTHWRELDYLVVDLPPGTGDIQLTLAQKVPVTGAVIVTTPQDIALIDARKGLKMFEKVGIPILGIVENMSIHICPKCGHESHIFGEGGAARMCKDYGTELLGQLPLDDSIREQADSGKPTRGVRPGRPVAGDLQADRAALRGAIAESQKDMTSKFPNIVVQNTLAGNLAEHRAAPYDAALRGGVVGRRAVHHAAVVPHDQLAGPPAVLVGEVRMDGERIQLLDQRAPFVVRHALDVFRVIAEVQALAAGFRMRAHDG